MDGGTSITIKKQNHIGVSTVESNQRKEAVKNRDLSCSEGAQ